MMLLLGFESCVVDHANNGDWHVCTLHALNGQHAESEQSHEETHWQKQGRILRKEKESAILSDEVDTGKLGTNFFLSAYPAESRWVPRPPPFFGVRLPLLVNESWRPVQWITGHWLNSLQREMPLSLYIKPQLQLIQPTKWLEIWERKKIKKNNPMHMKQLAASRWRLTLSSQTSWKNATGPSWALAPIKIILISV